jgi:hypothetical protein
MGFLPLETALHIGSLIIDFRLQSQNASTAGVDSLLQRLSLTLECSYAFMQLCHRLIG